MVYSVLSTKNYQLRWLTPRYKEIQMDDQSLKQQALYYHEFPTPGKISVTPSKQLVNQHDLALAIHQVSQHHVLEIEKRPF